MYRCIDFVYQLVILGYIYFHFMQRSASLASRHSDQPLFTDFAAGLSVGVLLGQMVDLSHGLILGVS